IKALIYSAVLNGVVAPIIIVQIVLIARSERLMGSWKSGRLAVGIGWLTVILMGFTGVAAIYSLFSQ
ncbi:MAG TPA: hypothetical protein VGS08_06090, partial [Candidatus Saccharimonadales bacterium]|nr:hypothetical protein [Candidatus Saccharimonadales bacterium]